jgi:hypothetical protein
MKLLNPDRTWTNNAAHYSPDGAKVQRAEAGLGVPDALAKKHLC